MTSLLVAHMTIYLLEDVLQEIEGGTQQQWEPTESAQGSHQVDIGAGKLSNWTINSVTDENLEAKTQAQEHQPYNLGTNQFTLQEVLRAAHSEPWDAEWWLRQ
jgi:hypothetical protein